MAQEPVICIGAMLWDTIAQASRPMQKGHDIAGRIADSPGGVAYNIAHALTRLNLTPLILSAVGTDVAGEGLITCARAEGINCDHLLRSTSYPTDRYMAIEDENGLVAAIADAHSLEAQGTSILTPLYNGALGRRDAPFTGRIVIDGNLSNATLSHMAQDPVIGAARLALVPASPGKAKRLRPFLGHGSAVFYTNLREAEIILGREFESSAAAAEQLASHGIKGALVSDGANAASYASAGQLITHMPPPLKPMRITGAGDNLLAGHLAAQIIGLPEAEQLLFALQHCAAYLRGDSFQPKA